MFTTKTRLISLLVTISMLISMVAYFTINVTANTGSATPIDSAEDFASIALDGNYILTQDIDFKNVAHTPIGTIDAPFTGTFDGDGYTISNLTLDSDDNFRGLFGVNNGTIRNVKMDSSCSISGNAYVGAIAGKNASTGIIENCISEATVSYTASSTVGSTYKVMTQNLCQWGDSEFAKYDTYLNSGNQLSRRPGMLARIKEVSPDLIAFQENSFTDMNKVSEDASWWDKLTGNNTNTVTAWKTVLENDSELESTYTFFGSQGSLTATPQEGATVAYRTDKFDLLTSGTFWHSTNPDAPIEQQDANWDVEQANGELWGFGAGNKRVVNWVALQDKDTAQKIVLYSLHPQHDSEEVRMKEIPVLLAKMDALRETYPDAIFIAAGDYNANKGAGSYNLVENYLNGEMDNARDIATSYVDESDKKNTSGNIYVGATGTIDHILIDGSAANVTSFEVRDELYDSLGTKYAATKITTNADSAYTGASDTLITRTTPLRPSDHNGVVATFEVRTDYAIGGVVGENAGSLRRIVAAGTADATAIGLNNGSALAVFGTGTKVGEGSTKGIGELTEEPSLEIVWKLNHAAEEDVFTLVDGQYVIMREGETYGENPVRVRVNGIDYYTLPNSGAFNLDQLGIKDPVLIDDGKLIDDPVITVGTEDIDVAVADSIMNVTEKGTTGVNDFVVKNQDELEYADSKLSYINKANVTLYLGADIDMTESSFDGFGGNIYFSFDGMGYTIKNWNAPTVKAFFWGESGSSGYQGEYIKNVNFDNCHTGGGYGRAIVVGIGFGPNDLLMENIHVSDSTVTIGENNNLAAIFYNNTNSNAEERTITIRNCSAINTEIKMADEVRALEDFKQKTNVGVITGRAGDGVTYKVSDIYVSGYQDTTAEDDATNARGHGILFGTKESGASLTVKNAGIYDSSVNGKSYDLVGFQYNGAVNASNIVSVGNATQGFTGKQGGSLTLSGSYTDQADKIGVITDGDGTLGEAETEYEGISEIAAADLKDGLVAYTINKALSKPAFYWEVDEDSATGALKPATAAEQTRKVTVKGATDEIYYADGGETLEIPARDGMYPYVAEGNGAINGVALLAEGEGTTDSLVVSSDKDTVVRYVDETSDAYQVVLAIGYYEGKNLDYYANANLAEHIEDAKARLADGTYATDAAQAAAMVTLLDPAYVTPDGADKKLPSVQEIANYQDAPGYMINNVDDLLYVKSVETGFTADHTLYLGADLDLKGVEFVGFSKVYFDFDGLGHTLSNWGVDMESKAIGLFHYSFNHSVKNLNIDGAKLDSTGNSHVSVIYGCHNTTNATGATGDLTFENIHIKNTSLIKNSGQGAFIISNLQAGRDNVTLNNCTVENSELTGAGGNLGALVGRTYTTTVVLTIKNCFVNNVDIKGGTTYCGILIGSLEGGCTPKIYNTVLMNSSTDASGTDTGVVAFANSNPITFENFVSYNNIGAENFIGGSLTTHSATNSYFTEDYTPNFGFVRVKENAIASGYVAAMLNTKVTDANGYTYWTMDNATDLPTFGTKENQTLSITYKVNDNVLAIDAAGSGATVELGFDADPAATFAVNAGTLAGDGKTLTMPTDGTHVVVTVTPSGDEFAYLGYPSVTTVSAAVTSGDYTVANATEWMYLYNNYTTLFNNTDITIHLIGTIDLSEGVASSFSGFMNACFSVEGHGNTICNWGTEGSPVSADGIFRSANSTYGGTGTPALMNSLKNFTVDNVHMKGTNRGNGLVLGFGAANAGLSAIPTSFLMEGVIVKNCSLVANGEDSAILVPRYSNSDVTTESLTITRCAVIDTAFTSTGDHHGVLYGKAPGNTGTAYIYGNYMRNVTVNENTAKGALAIGTIEGSTVHLYYNTVIDSSITAAAGAEAYLAANSSGGSHYNRYNIFINNTVTSDTGTYYLGDAGDTAASAITCNNTNQVSDSKIAGTHATGTTYGCLEGATGSWVTCPSAANIANGNVAYTNNNYLSDGNQNALLANRVVFWEMEDGKIVPADKAGQTVMATLKTAGGNTLGTFYVDGGETLTLSLMEGEIATLANGSSATASISGNIFTAPTDGSDTEIIISGSEVLGYPSVSTITAALTEGGDYTIYNESDWDHVETNISFFQRKDVTIHLAADIDLSKISFTRFLNPAFSFDGHGHTVSNWGTEAAPISTNGMFVVTNGNGAVGTMNFIKNLKFYNCYINAAGTCTAMLYGSYQANAGLAAESVTDLRIENIHFNQCGIKIANTSEGVAFILSRYSVAGATSTVTINNCSVIDSTLGGPEAIGGHYGFMIGKPRNGNSGGSTTYNITNCYMEGSTVEYNRAAHTDTASVTDAQLSNPTTIYGGLIFGTAETQGDNTIMKLTNIGVVGCTLDMGDYVRPVEEGVRDAEVGVTVANLGGTTQGSPVYANGVIFKDNKVEGANVSKVYIFGGDDIRQMDDVYCDTDLTAAASGNAAIVVTADTAYLEGAGDINVAAVDNNTLYWTTNESNEAVRGTLANATRRVSYQVGGKEVARGPAANGGTTVALSLDVDPNATFSGEGVDGKNYTVPTDAPMLAPVTVTYSDADLIAASGYPAVSTVGAALAAGGDYTIYNEADWDYLETNIAYFQRQDVTIHLAADIDLSKITFAGFQEPAFSFNGHGFTVRNWGSPSVYVSATAMFVFDEAAASGGADTIENLNIEDCYVSGRAILVGGVNTNGGLAGLSTNFTVENVHIKNSGLKGNTNFNAFFIGGYGSTDGDYTVNLKNCSLIDSSMVGGGSGHAGMLIGKISGSGTATKPTYNVTNIYMEGNTYTAGRANAHYEGMIIGNVEVNSTVNISNLVAIGNTAVYKHTEATTAVAYFGNFDQGTATLDGIVLLENSISNTTDASAKKYLFTAHNAPTFNIGTVYCDDTSLAGDNEKISGIKSVLGDEALVSGEAAAYINVAGEAADSVFFYTTTEDGVALSSEADATRRVVYAVDNREVEFIDFANGGEEIEIGDYAYDPASTMKFEGAEVENPFTVPTAGYMMVPIDVETTGNSTLTTVYGYPAVTTVGAAVTSGDYTVANAEEWMYVANHTSYFSNLEVTIHLIGTIDFSEDVAKNFTGFQNVKFSLNGHDHTLKNWKPTSNADGLFNTNGDAGMKFIKNFTIDNADVKLNTWAALVFGSTSNAANNAGYYANFELSGIHVKNTTVRATGNGATALFGEYRRASGVETTVTVHDCSFENVDVIGTGSSANHGMIFGRLDKGATFNIYDIYINNCSVTKASNSGIVGSGLEAGTLNAHNIGVFNSMHTPVEGQDAHLFCVQIGGTIVFRHNIFAGNTLNNGEGYGKYVIGGASGGNAVVGGGSSINDTNQCDDPALTEAHYAGTLAGAVKGQEGRHLKKGLTDEDFANGAVAYTNNGYNADLLANRTLFWTIKDGNIIPADGNQTRKVTFTVVDDEGNPSASQVYTYYTDYTKKLIPEFDSFLYKNYKWTETTSGDAYTLDTTFTADAAYTAVGVVLDELEDALAYFSKKNLGEGTYFKDAAGIQALLDEIETRIAENEYQVSENAVPGLGFASLDKDIKLVKERYATYQDPNEEFTNVPKVSEVGIYDDAFHYTIWNETDLLTAKSNEAKYPQDSTLNLMADLDLTDVTFAGFKTPKFNFDGHEHTIANWTYNGGNESGVAFISRGTGHSIKNLTFDTVNLTAGTHSGVVYGSHSSDANVDGGLTIENVHVKKATINAYDEQIALFLPNTQSARTHYIIRNCSAVDSQIVNVNGEAENCLSAFVARTWGGSTIEITDCHLENFKIPYGANAVSLFCSYAEAGGKIDLNNNDREEGIRISNVSAYNCEINATGDIYLMGARRAVGRNNQGGEYKLQNVLLGQIEAKSSEGTVYLSAGNLHNYALQTVGDGVVDAENHINTYDVNIYMDQTTYDTFTGDYILYHNHDDYVDEGDENYAPSTYIRNPIVLEDDAFTSGKAAWQANQVLIDAENDARWKVGDHGDYPVIDSLAASDWKVPYQVILNENRTKAGESYDFYTNKSGALNTTAQARMGDYTWTDAESNPYTKADTFSADKALTLESIVAIDVTWGEMEFVYNFGEWDEDNCVWVGNGWESAEGTDNGITFANNGTVYCEVALTYEKGGDSYGLAGQITKVDDLTGDLSAIPVEADGVIHSYEFMLNDLPAETWDDNPHTVGNLTISIV